MFAGLAYYDTQLGLAAEMKCHAGIGVHKKNRTADLLRINSPIQKTKIVSSGARGSRTLVQTGKPYAFYTLSHR